MAKKRVYELAKDLGLSNKEMVDWLRAHEYDVKSHSSSLEDDQALAATEKFKGERSPKAVVAKPSGSGVVLRRKRADTAAEAEHENVPEVPAQVVTPVIEAAPEPAPEPVRPPPPVAPPPAVVVSAPPPAPVVVPEPPPAPVEPVKAAPVVVPEPPPAAPPVVAEKPAEPVAPVVAAPPEPPPAPVPVVAPPQAPPMQSSRPEQKSAQGTQVSNVPAGVAKVAARPAPPPPPRIPVRPPPPKAPTGPIVQGPGGVQSVQVTENIGARPSATRAVVLSRPLIPIARPAPRPPPGGGGFRPRPVGEVRELAVVSGGPGRGREFIDVTKDQKGAPTRGKKGPRVEKTETISRQDLVALAQQRAYVPVRGHKKKSAKKGKSTEITEMSEHKKVLHIEETITVAEMSQAMGVKAADLIRKLMAAGKMVTQNQPIDFETATTLAAGSGWKVEKVGFEIGEFIEETEDKPEDMAQRPPVVTIMGHVDHGKTSLLDAIRKAHVAEGEAGGITQHIGAYSVDVVGSDGGELSITFLDTPGHEAFTAMRARGANVTDIAVLVVSADDGVMPQTVESINHAKAAEVVVVVAINKIDKPGAQPDRIKQQLSEHGLVAEEWGGDTMMVPVSARTGEGIEKLLESILLQAEVLELKANPHKPATGAVIEAKLEKGRGPVATVLVQDGTLHVGDAIVTGNHFGRVRAMMNEHGEQVDDVPPGFPVEVLGLDGAPDAGEEFNVVEDEATAAIVAEHRTTKARDKELSKSTRLTIDDILAKGKKDESKVLKIIVKADVQGSVEALRLALVKLSTAKVAVDVIDWGVGNVTESNVHLAVASKAMIVGFNVKPESKAAETASSLGVTLKHYSIIYEALDDVKLAMEGLLESIIKEKVVGHAKVLQMFNVPKLGAIAGSSVTDGKITRASMVRLLRDKKSIITSKIASLRRFKDDVKEVDMGYECGIGIENFTDFQPGDVIEAYELETIRPSLT
ncbi:MAG TPA: translation initiation factor IF-2 [Myxococcales bacterium]|nr:translation initiation factor IF-2 [Myxococcales bacterium]